MRRSLYVRHDRAFLAAALVVVLLGFGSWWWLQNQTDHGVARTTSTCAQVDRLYSDVALLLEHDNAIAPARVDAMLRQRVERLAAQGCAP